MKYSIVTWENRYFPILGYLVHMFLNGDGEDSYIQLYGTRKRSQATPTQRWLLEIQFSTKKLSYTTSPKVPPDVSPKRSTVWPHSNSVKKILHWIIFVNPLHPVCLHFFRCNLYRQMSLERPRRRQMKRRQPSAERQNGNIDVPHHYTWHYISSSVHPSLLVSSPLPVQTAK